MNFVNEVIDFLLNEFMLIHQKLAPYHAQANGQVEISNKILCTILTKIVEISHTDWKLKLHLALWAYRVTYKISVETTTFKIAFGLDAILSLEFLLPTLWVAQSVNRIGHELFEWLEDLERLDETCLQMVTRMYALKHR